MYKNDGETISIKKQKIERIRDVKVQGENAFILSNKYGERKVDLIQLTLNKNDVHSLISFDLQDNQATYDLKIDLLAKDYLIVSISPQMTPAPKPSAKLITVNYKSKMIIDEFTFDSADIDVGINMVCIGGSKSLVPIVAYTKNNGNMFDLVTELEGEKYILNSDKNQYYQIETKYSNGVFYILSSYINSTEKRANQELSLFHISNKEFVACD
ncbi:MAG: hypothetical protein GY815_15575 [Gammaproteobacteria bacterium]|nr:hypothetical protein [Gammaproteobacteria bacterium]